VGSRPEWLVYRTSKFSFAAVEAISMAGPPHYSSKRTLLKMLSKVATNVASPGSLTR